MPTSVLRRYTPPTCTLEVRANQSSLSRWADQTVLRDVRFNLNLDDPQRPDARVVQVSGDRTQLEALSDVINRYVQDLLDTDLSRTDTALLQLTPQSPQLLERNLETLPLGAERTSRTNGSPIALHAPIASVESGIFLEPRGLLAHDLHLGTLSTAESGDVVRLSAVQLFDLANALDDYSAEMLALPSQQRAAVGTRRWASIAAMLVLAIGATGGIAKFVMDVSAPTATQVAQESAPENTAQIESLPPSSDPATGTPLPVPGAAPQAGDLKVPPAAPPGSAQPGAFPFPVPAQQPNAAPSGQMVPVPSGPPAVRPVPPGPVAQVPQPNPGGAAGTSQGINVPPNPTVTRQAPPDTFSTSQAPSLSATGEAAPEAAAGDVAIAPPPTTRNRPTTDLSRTGVEIPQTNEVESYFQERWQPPENLGETLEYRLNLGADGTVQQITPLGDAAGVYIDRTNMPLLGDRFVSPLTPYQGAMVRVVLAPDGTVQTFLEEVN